MLHRMIFFNTFAIPQGDGASAVVIIDEQMKRTMAFVITEKETMDMAEILSKSPKSKLLLPYVLTKKLEHDINLLFYTIRLDSDAEYGVLARLVNSVTKEETKLLAQDAIMLSLISCIDIYCTERVLRYYSSPFVPGKSFFYLPILALPYKLLQRAMDEAVEKENYEMAKFVRDEMERRQQRGDIL